MAQTLDQADNEVLPSLLASSAEAVAWIGRARAALEHSAPFGRLASSVVWTDERDTDGELLVSLDPEELAANINAGDFDLLIGHDPGRPHGKVLTAAPFVGADGTRFVAALLGFYRVGASGCFGDLGVDTLQAAPSPRQLPPLPEGCWIEFITDPRDIASSWVDEVLATAPLPIERNEASYNDADTTHELVRLGVAFITLVWNPFVTTIANEAGKDAYAAMRTWLRRYFSKLIELRDPITEIQSHHGGCQIAFIFRGRDIERLYKAHDALPIAAAQAAHLVASLAGVGAPPKKIVYEFHWKDDLWYPSFAELRDGRLITDNSCLIAAERLPKGLSLGIGRETPRLPRTRRAEP